MKTIIALAGLFLLIFSNVCLSQFTVDSFTVALWHFDEGTGDTLYDSSPNGNHGVIYGATWVDGKFGKGLDFNPGNEAFVLVPSSPSLQLSSAITIEAWIKPRSLVWPLNMIVQKGDGSSGNSYWFATDGDGRLHFQFGISHELVGDTTVDLGDFSNVAVTWESSTGSFKFYVNLTLDIETGVTGSLPITDSPLGIGVTPGGSYFFDGVIDEVRISNIARIPGLRAPVIDSVGPRYVAEGETLSFKITATDSSGYFIPALTAVNPPANSFFADSGNGSGLFLFTPSYTQVGEYSVTFIASNPFLSDTEVVPISIFDRNGRPILDSFDSLEVAEAETLRVRVHATDPDSTALILQAFNLPLNSSFFDSSNGSGSFLFTPNYYQSGDYNVSFAACDSELCDTQVVRITVNCGITVKGDATGNGHITVGDIIYLINFLFKHGPPPQPDECNGDVDNSGGISVSDLIYLINYLFRDGPTISPRECCI